MKKFLLSVQQLRIALKEYGRIQTGIFGYEEIM